MSKRLIFVLLQFILLLEESSQLKLTSHEQVEDEENLKELQQLPEKTRKLEELLKRNQTFIGISDLKNVEIKLDELDDEEISTYLHVPIRKESSESPTFSIHAQKVYILYPTSFTQPNMFGQMSIPQHIKMENDLQRDQTSNPITNEEKSIYPVSKQVVQRRNLLGVLTDNEIDENDEENRRVDITTHLKGSIVVLNQDVSERNNPKIS